MIYILERKDVEYEHEHFSNYLEDCMNYLGSTVEALEDYAENSIYEDSSKGNYEDNTYYVCEKKEELIKELEKVKKDIDDYISKIKEIEVCQ